MDIKKEYKRWLENATEDADVAAELKTLDDAKIEDSLKEDVFKDHVGRVSVKAIIRAAKERRPGALGYSEAMIIEYNKKSKFRLSLKTLYGGKQTSDEDEFGEE